MEKRISQCEMWTNEMLDNFLEKHKRLKNGLIVYPIEEWAEKAKRLLTNTATPKNCRIKRYETRS